MPTVKVEARFFHWEAEGMVPGRPAGADQKTYLELEEVAALLLAAHRRGFEEGVATAASVVRGTQIRPG